MGKHWLRYLAVWLVSLIFFFAYRQWLAWVVLMSISLLPLLSFAVSLPAMLLSRLELTMPESVTMGQIAPLQLSLRCPLPLPLWTVRTVARHSLTQTSWILQSGLDCPTEHCGALYISFTRGRVYDYLGLFFLPKKTPADIRLLIRPQQLRPKDLPDPDKKIYTYWKPKAGGGFSENHELRLYRPGDSLRQIHWKLSGKTGNLIYREPMVLANNDLLLRLVHSGTPAQLDRKLGKLLWLGLYLQRRGLAFDVLADTAEGQKLWHITSKRTLINALDALLCAKPLEQGEVAVTQKTGSLWQYYIGGDSCEA